MFDCFSCEQNVEFEHRAPREHIVHDEHWRVAHAFNATEPGWLVLIPRRHVTTVSELTDAEAATLGSWQVRLSRALHATTGCAKTYVVQFAESEGFDHVHFHIVARRPDLPIDRRGPKVFGLLNKEGENWLPSAEMDALALEIRFQLQI